MLRVALHGRSGAGKSTTSGILRQTLTDRGMRVAALKLAEPLYDVQRMVYSLCGRPLTDAYQQDGILLSSLGESFRRIDEQSLIRLFTARLHQAESAGFDAVICDDMRKHDYAELARIGFRIVRVQADDAIRLHRRAHRVDLAPVSDGHQAEEPIDASEFDIHNDGSFAELQAAVVELMDKLLGERDRAGR